MINVFNVFFYWPFYFFSWPFFNFFPKGCARIVTRRGLRGGKNQPKRWCPRAHASPRTHGPTHWDPMGQLLGSPRTNCEISLPWADAGPQVRPSVIIIL